MIAYLKKFEIVAPSTLECGYDPYKPEEVPDKTEWKQQHEIPIYSQENVI